jgi:carboxyl-terminal processing protease
MLVLIFNTFQIQRIEMSAHNQKYLLPIILSLVLALGLWMGNSFSKNNDPFGNFNADSKYQKIQDIIDIIDRKYVDTVNGEKLFEETISDMLHKLDPHSNYIPARDLARLNESIEGQFGGVGVRFFILRDTICITNVIKGSPSEFVGIKAGDKILEIDGKKVAGMKISNDGVMGKLKGKPQTAVSVRLLRKGKIINKRIVRDLIPISSVSAYYMINATTGYIKIDEFSMTTSKEFRRAALILKEKGMKKMVLDLRNNGGGVMTSATDIADEFLSANKVIVKTKGEHHGTQVYRSTAQGILEDIQLSVLINSYSASASEILAGAVQDNDRGVIVGRRSFGKGLVQEDMKLRDGSNLRLTIARYYTPTGRCIQKPYSDDIEEYYQDQLDRYDSGELYAPDSSLFVDSLKYKTPKGKIVYGGGGIMPDKFIPYDSTGNSWYLSDLRFSLSFQAFAFDYVHNQGHKWNSFAQFDKSFNVDDNLLQRFAVFAEKEMKIKRDSFGLSKSKVLIKRILKAEIARQIWLEEGYFSIMNQTDTEVQAALKAL